MKSTVPNQLNQERLAELRVRTEDFRQALSIVLPSAKREGFATVPDVTWANIGALKDIRIELEWSILVCFLDIRKMGKWMNFYEWWTIIIMLGLFFWLVKMFKKSAFLPNIFWYISWFWTEPSSLLTRKTQIVEVFTKKFLTFFFRIQSNNQKASKFWRPTHARKAFCFVGRRVAVKHCWPKRSLTRQGWILSASRGQNCLAWYFLYFLLCTFNFCV